MIAAARIAAKSYGGSVSWEIPLGLDVASGPATVLRARLEGPDGERAISVTIDTTTRRLTYTIGRYEVDKPGSYNIVVDLQLTTTRVERVSFPINVYPARRRPV